MTDRLQEARHTQRAGISTAEQPIRPSSRHRTRSLFTIISATAAEFPARVRPAVSEEERGRTAVHIKVDSVIGW